jgi:RNA polymerase sigma factor (sigma-70 family)
MNQATKDPSLDCLDVLQDAHADQVEREAAFSEMMSMNSGWWGRRSLYDFAVACTFACARYKLTPHNISVDRIDFEGLAGEGLMILFRKAGEIRESPRGWLAGVLKNLVKSEIRDNWHHLSASEMPEEMLGDNELSDSERTSLTLDDTVIDAIRRLSPALRVVAELHYIHQVPRHELASYIEVSEETLRKRLMRAREALQKQLNPMCGDVKPHEPVGA